MSALPPISLAPEEKLDLLRHLDEFHFWHSLDDRRFCQKCGHAIAGSQVQVIEVAGTRGKLRLRCPTEGCASTPGDWIYADPVLAASWKHEFRSFGLQSTAPHDIALSHHGHVCSVRLTKHRSTENAPAATRSSNLRQWPVSFRAMLARLPMLRPLATGLHAFRPIA